MEIQKSPWFEHGNFLIFVFQYTEIQKSPCIETWRFCKAKLFIFYNLHVSIHGDSKIFVYKTHKFFNLRVSIHGDSKISVYWNMEIQKLPCFIHADFFLKGQLLSEIATDDENILGCESRDWVRPIYEKNRVRNLMLLSL